MPTKNFSYDPEGVISSITVSVTEGSEPALGAAVNLFGVPNPSARGVVYNSRNGLVNIATLGQIPVKVLDGQSISAGAAVMASDSSGCIEEATTNSNVLGIALEAISSANNDFIQIFVNPYILI